MELIAGYRLRLYPNRQEGADLRKLSDARRFVWNWALAYCQEQFKATGKTPSRFDLCARLTVLRAAPDTSWLADFSVDILRSSLIDLEQAFKKWWKKKGRYPRFKTRFKDPLRFRIANKGVQLVDGKLSVPKIGWMTARGRITDGVVIACAVTFVCGRWEASVQVREHREVLPVSESGVGIDLGLKSLVSTSDGLKIEAPKFLRKAARQIKRASQNLARKVKGSANRAKAKQRLARIHARAAAKREAFLHHITTDLVRENGTLAIEDLCVKGMAKTRLAKSVLDAAFREFRRQVEYKCAWYGRRLVVADRWFASSKLCSNCGWKNDALTLSDRSWVCGCCGVVHDRDFNAATNLKNLAGGWPDSLNACGGDVRLDPIEQTPTKQEDVSLISRPN